MANSEKCQSGGKNEKLLEGKKKKKPELRKLKHVTYFFQFSNFLIVSIFLIFQFLIFNFFFNFSFLFIIIRNISSFFCCNNHLLIYFSEFWLFWPCCHIRLIFCHTLSLYLLLLDNLFVLTSPIFSP